MMAENSDLASHGGLLNACSLSCSASKGQRRPSACQGPIACSTACVSHSYMLLFWDDHPRPGLIHVRDHVCHRCAGMSISWQSLCWKGTRLRDSLQPHVGRKSVRGRRLEHEADVIHPFFQEGILHTLPSQSTAAFLLRNVSSTQCLRRGADPKKEPPRT